MACYKKKRFTGHLSQNIYLQTLEISPSTYGVQFKGAQILYALKICLPDSRECDTMHEGGEHLYIGFDALIKIM